MNQAIQFPDSERWDETLQAVCFPALVNGITLTCAIHGTALIQRFGEQGAALALFQSHRWDLEDEAETLIKQQQENDQGWLWLSSSR